jgi:acetyltransferase-like isoleucine patch superfamily enzyme
MRKLLNKILTKIKGESYEIDKQVPLSYLFSMVLSRSCMLCRGFFSRVKNGGMLFIGRQVTFKVKRAIRAGRMVTINSGCYIDALSTGGVSFGNNVSLGKRVIIECTGNLKYIGKGLQVGNNVGLGSDNFFGCAGGIQIGDDTILGNFISFHAENHVFSDLSVPIRLQGVAHRGIKIGSNCWIGSKVTVLDGAAIEDGCIIAAGAVVAAGVYACNCIYGGIPAKLIRKRN